MIMRGVSLLIATAALGWAGATLPAEVAAAPARALADRLLAGQSFGVGVLKEASAKLPPSSAMARCRAEVAPAAVVLWGSLREAARAEGDLTLADAAADTLRENGRVALACAPQDGYLWLVQFWARSVEEGYRPALLPLLEASVAAAPNEGWVILRRAPLMLALFDDLPTILQERTLAEFTKLVEANFMRAAVAMFLDMPRARREAVLARVAALPERRRESFVRLLRTEGVQVALPGIEVPPARPWDR